MRMPEGARLVRAPDAMKHAMTDKFELQNRLFSELSRMFGREVPLYDRALAVNAATNRAVCDLLARLHRGFSMSADRLERTSGERHGAIRIGRPDEYRWVARFFGVFGMEPHNFYDMTAIGAKSQPIIATAFRSVLRPEHRPERRGDDRLALGADRRHVVEVVRLHPEHAEEPGDPSVLVRPTDADGAVALSAGPRELRVAHREA